MKRKLLTIAFLLVALPHVHADDWPTFMRDASRSGVSSESLSYPLKASWSWASKYPPRPAWTGPAKEDKYSKPGPLVARLLFDRTFFTVSAGNSLVFGSSADDKIYCLDADTGKQRWAFFTEGPVRFAPTIVGDRLFAGSDDGRVYCLSLTDGKLIWKRMIGPRDRRVPGNGRMVSAWPVRGGVCVVGSGKDQTVYCAAGMFPNDGVFATALNAADGKPIWQTNMGELPAQGYTLASASKLYVPTGRNNPTVFDRKTGKQLYTVNGGQGGTYCLLTGDQLVFGPGKTGVLGVTGNNQRDQLATFAGNHMIVTAAMSYLHTDTELSALDRKRYLELLQDQRVATSHQKHLAKVLKALGSKGDPAKVKATRDELIELGKKINALTQAMAACMKWKVKCDAPESLILVGNTLIAGGDNKIAAYDTTDGKLKWQGPVEGKAYGLTVANGRLFVSTHRGTIHCFSKGDLQ